MGLHLQLPPGTGLIIALAIIAITLIFRVGPLLLGRGRPRITLPPGTQRDYGFAGGAICPNCHHPVQLSLFSVKVGFGAKLARCEFCGKVSVMRRASLEELRRAEAAELADAQPSQAVLGKSEAEKEKERLDDSRFTDHS